MKKNEKKWKKMKKKTIEKQNEMNVYSYFLS